ncbi:gramicidin S synthase 2 [Streptomyces scabiei]|uniref:Gramicidin S synthase 2 n=1 Tax=Streptomyces scabiei TaxID=1930 RepID=A0A100JIA4_STRSC|nr:gramicidin S synthase 2 [Streptomyces scabiei]
MAGEICVGGAGVALGHLGQEELTARRFVPDPYTGGTMCRSGDLGRLRPDGRLEHLGRLDSQVKIRGFRIEPDEIRSVLLEDPDVRAAAVVVRRDDPDDDFFELGGNSLFAVRIAAVMRAQGLPSLRMRELYRRPTIRGTVNSLATSDG